MKDNYREYEWPTLMSLLVFIDISQEPKITSIIRLHHMPLAQHDLDYGLTKIQAVTIIVNDVKHRYQNKECYATPHHNIFRRHYLWLKITVKTTVILYN